MFGGAITSCAIDQALPSGLTFNSVNCSVSGTVLGAHAVDTFTITPSNSVGAGASVQIQIEAIDSVPDIGFSASVYDFPLLAAASTGIPVNSGGLITSCGVSPALPAGLSIGATTCLLSGTPNVVEAPNSYTITPTNAVGSGVPRVLSLQVHNVVPNIAFLSGIYVFGLGSAALTDTPVNSGGTITGCAVSPALPAGLSIAATTCVISGTPSSVVGPVSYTVTPSNAEGSGTGRSISIEISNAVPDITFGAGSYDFYLNAGSSTGAPSNSGGGITGCLVSPGLPAGLSLSATTCEISGTGSVVSADTAYTVTPSNAVGSGTSQVIHVEVHNVVPSISYSSASFAFSLQAGSTTGVPTNTGGAITGCSVSPALPSGLSIAATTCVISGTPSVVAANASYTVTPSNGVGSGTDVVISIAVSNVVPAIAYAGSPYTFSLNAAASSGVHANTGGAITGCSVSPALPSGLSIAATTCVISGTPSVVSGSSSYTITPSNGVGSGTGVAVSIAVANVVPAIAYVGSPYAFSLNAAASSGTPANTGGAITSCAVSPALPAGLSITATTCAISGTPSVVSGSSSYTITPSNGVGSGTGVAISIAVADVVPEIEYNTHMYAFGFGSNVTDIPSNSGGAITNCTISPALPSGGSISPTTCQITVIRSIVLLESHMYDITPSNSGGSGPVFNLTILYDD